MTLHVMLDIETLALSPNAQITSIGAVTFDPLTGDIYGELELFPALGTGRIDASTVIWWMQQDDDARKSLYSRDRSTPKECADQLQAFIRTAGEEAMVWALGPQFDCVVLTQSLEAWLDEGTLWHYRQIADARTLRLFYNETQPEPRVKHSALEDARAQAIWTAAALKHMGYVPSEVAP